jgi:hypothetical protein
VIPPVAAAGRAPRGGDLVASILILVGSVLGWAAGSFFIFFVVGLFGGDCIDPTCGAYAGVAAEKVAILVAASVVAVGIVVTVIRLIVHRKSWPFALGAFLLCGACITVGGIVFLLDA